MPSPTRPPGNPSRPTPPPPTRRSSTAVATADAAFRAWNKTALAERVKLLRRVADLYTERRDELAAIITREMGKPVFQARIEVDIVASIYRYYAENGPSFLEDEELEVAAGGKAIVRKDGLGVLLGIMPWNFPYYQVARFAAPNLMNGNTILLKHAPQCPESALAMEQIFLDAGAPEGAYVNIFATNEQVADIIADPRVQGVSLTGSERAGSAVAEIAGRNLKKVVLELGGSDPFLVLESADLEQAATHALFGRFGNTGQACNAAKRIIVGGRRLRRIRREVRPRRLSCEGGRPHGGRHVHGAAVLHRRPRRARRAGGRRRRQGRHGAHRRQPAGPARCLVRADGPRRSDRGHARLLRGTLRPGRRSVPRFVRRRGCGAGQQLRLRPRRRHPVH